jgi:hypothetical protein
VLTCEKDNGSGLRALDSVDSGLDIEAIVCQLDIYVFPFSQDLRRLPGFFTHFGRL